MRAYERLLRYVQFDTVSDENNPNCPSTEGQRVLAEALAEELRGMGVSDARVDKNGYVYGSIPANAENQPAIGLIAHMDTAQGVPCMPMNARVVANYDGGDIALDAEAGVYLRPSEYETLSGYVGQDLIVTDGHTLLGADNKAGVAEIMTLASRILSNPFIPHGRVCIGFTPDEEIGRGADLFDVAAFGADFAYTVDGGELGEIEYENFNAAAAEVLFEGLSIHPGAAKNKMRNASLMALRFHGMLPPEEAPAHTEGYEGFYHLIDMTGDCEHAKLRYIIRDHDAALFEAKKRTLEQVAAFLNAQYGGEYITLRLRDSYRNMREMILPRMDIIGRAEDAMRAVGVSPRSIPIRGGTDGARLSYMGLLCPNLCCGGVNMHGRFEYVSVQTMDKIVDILEGIVRAR